eukprot:CAMPEP_0115198820 /NCGR_PEP_ID=MMETSP0270-20121206/16299_1 /TAXON_ID=71861 /ORGANISM="Scrippsiella trochoidea, Strain CCMP3099" /LENGTH=245 /DNA_ID=CAMNT_0002612197 /DNA_START=414 /DNA_END=1147 /DNA_ORIENTATION=+
MRVAASPREWSTSALGRTMDVASAQAKFTKLTGFSACSCHATKKASAHEQRMGVQSNVGLAVAKDHAIKDKLLEEKVGMFARMWSFARSKRAGCKSCFLAKPHNKLAISKGLKSSTQSMDIALTINIMSSSAKPNRPEAQARVDMHLVLVSRFSEESSCERCINIPTLPKILNPRILLAPTMVAILHTPSQAVVGCAEVDQAHLCPFHLHKIQELVELTLVCKGADGMVDMPGTHAVQSIACCWA